MKNIINETFTAEFGSIDSLQIYVCNITTQTKPWEAVTLDFQIYAKSVPDLVNRLNKAKAHYDLNIIDVKYRSNCQRMMLRKTRGLITLFMGTEFKFERRPDLLIKKKSD